MPNDEYGLDEFRLRNMSTAYGLEQRDGPSLFKLGIQLNGRSPPKGLKRREEAYLLAACKCDDQLYPHYRLEESLSRPQYLLQHSWSHLVSFFSFRPKSESESLLEQHHKILSES